MTTLDCPNCGCPAAPRDSPTPHDCVASLKAEVARLQQVLKQHAAGNLEASNVHLRAENQRLRDNCICRVDINPAVNFYEREFYPLSNFSAFTLMWGGHLYPTSEQAYHAEKFPCHPEFQERIRTAASAHEAFKLAEALRQHVRPHWNEQRVGIMRQILRAKAEQHEYVRRKLLETDERPLIEMSWRDAFWGWGPNRDGENMLGKLWMEIRAELRATLAGKEG